jgi:hypothetical protein
MGGDSVRHCLTVCNASPKKSATSASVAAVHFGCRAHRASCSASSCSTACKSSGDSAEASNSARQLASLSLNVGLLQCRNRLYVLMQMLVLVRDYHGIRVVLLVHCHQRASGRDLFAVRAVLQNARDDESRLLKHGVRDAPALADALLNFSEVAADSLRVG